jgi:YidC/Oxa1 family membrane protein insertase
VKILDDLATVVAFVLEQIHNGLSQFLPDESGWAWGLSIVLLTVTVRIAIFPLFVKQTKSMRRMQEIAPKVKALQTKHKGDRETLNTELMKLYKDHGTNPISGCLPMILQLPIFFSLFRVMNEVKPKSDGTFHGKYGLSDELIAQAAHAKVFGAPISAAFNSSPSLLQQLDGNATVVKIVAAIMVVTMGATTFWTQRQMMARNTSQLPPEQAQVQKIMLYVLPLSFAVFGFSFPVGVLLYWLTTNFWSVGQQRYILKRMPPVVAGAAVPAKGGADKGGATKVAAKQVTQGEPAADDEPAPPKAGTATPAKRPSGGGPGSKRHAGSRKNKKRRR